MLECIHSYLKKIDENCVLTLHFVLYLQVNVLKTKFSAPKKVSGERPKGVQSAAVRAFLEKQEQEKKKQGNTNSFLTLELFCWIVNGYFSFIWSRNY